MVKIITKWCLSLMILNAVFLTGCSNDIGISNLEKKKNIDLVLKIDNGYYWGTVKQGADTAAREFNVNLRLYTPTSDKDIDQQINIVNQVLRDKNDALIIAPADYNGLTEAIENASLLNIPTIIIDTQVSTNKISSFISTDYFDAGIKTGATIADITGPNAKVAILSTNDNMKTKQRQEGIYNVLSGYPEIKIVESHDNEDEKQAYGKLKEIIENSRDVDAVVAMDALASEVAVDVVKYYKLEGRVKIISFESTPKEIDYMDKGLIQATVVENPFSIGYTAVKNAVAAIDKNKIPAKVDIESKIILRENMYLPENQKILFPFVN